MHWLRWSGVISKLTFVSVVPESVPRGDLRNVGFTCLGLSIPFGLIAGLITVRVPASEPVGWRLDFRLFARLVLVPLATNIPCLYPDPARDKD